MTAAGRASVALPANAMIILEATRLFQLWVVAAHGSETKKRIEVKTKTGRYPKYLAVGTQKKFYETSKSGGLSSREYPHAQSEHNIIDEPIDSLIDSQIVFLQNHDNRSPRTRNGPIGKTGKPNDWKERRSLFPHGPIERIVDIVGRLGDEFDVGILLVFIHMVFYRQYGAAGVLPSTSLTVPSPLSRSFNDLNVKAALNMLSEFAMEWTIEGYSRDVRGIRVKFVDGLERSSRYPRVGCYQGWSRGVDPNLYVWHDAIICSSIVVAQRGKGSHGTLDEVASLKCFSLTAAELWYLLPQARSCRVIVFEILNGIVVDTATNSGT
jgi:hypothetical protein